MSAGEIAIIVAAAVVIVIVAVILIASSRHRRLRRQFGTEYDRTVEQTGSKREAEDELRARSKRHDHLHIVELSPRTRMQYRATWDDIQTHFVDEPERAMSNADELVQQVMTGRGYPLGDFEQQTADLSVEHASVLDNYRRAHQITESCKRGHASTEELRQGMVHYRALFNDLLGDPDGTRDSDQVRTGQGGRNDNRA